MGYYYYYLRVLGWVCSQKTRVKLVTVRDRVNAGRLLSEAELTSSRVAEATAIGRRTGEQDPKSPTEPPQLAQRPVAAPLVARPRRAVPSGRAAAAGATRVRAQLDALA